MLKITAAQISEDLLLFLKNNIIDVSVDVAPTTPLKSIGVDSFSVIELVLFLERKYSIKIQEKDMIAENFMSIEALTKCAIRYI